MIDSTQPIWKLRQEIVGPFTTYLDEYTTWLNDQCFCRRYMGYQIRQVASFSCWLMHQQVPLKSITHRHIDQFIDSKNRPLATKQGSFASLYRFVKYLVDVGVELPSPAVQSFTPIQKVVKSFGQYLVEERDLSPKTPIQYTPFIERLLVSKFADRSVVDLSLLEGKDIIRFIQLEARRLSTARAKVATNAVRAFIRWGMYRHQLSSALLASVPKVASWSQPGISKAISAADIERLLASCNRDTVGGRRDYAVLLLLARLGLRSAEIASLTLEAIDWASGTLAITGKLGKRSLLPLPADTASAIVDYLCLRPPVSSRLIFTRTKAPYTPLGAPQSIASIVYAAIVRAGVSPPTRGTHQFRHALATTMLKQGANLIEIGCILRHDHAKTTNIYTKVDIESLRALSPVWPGGVL